MPVVSVCLRLIEIKRVYRGHTRRRHLIETMISVQDTSAVAARVESVLFVENWGDATVQYVVTLVLAALAGHCNAYLTDSR